MKIRFYQILLIFLFCCNSDVLEISNLRVVDPEKIALKENNIRESIIMYDTASFSKALFTKDKVFHQDQFMEFCKEGFGTGFIKYDSNGNIVERNIREFMGTVETYRYDSLQLPIQKDYDTDFTASYTVSNFFDKENRRLYQYWKGGDAQDTTIFDFNNKGLIASETGRLHDDKTIKRTYRKEYFYEDNNLAKIITTFTDKNHSYTQSIETMKYKDGLINERITLYEGLNEAISLLPIKKETILYNEKGLPIRLILATGRGREIIKTILNR